MIKIVGSQLELLDSSASSSRVIAVSMESSNSSPGSINVHGSSKEILLLNPVDNVRTQGLTLEISRLDPVRELKVFGNSLEILHNDLGFDQIRVNAITIEVLRVIPGKRRRGPVSVVAN